MNPPVSDSEVAVATAARPWLQILLVVSQLAKSSRKNYLILTRVFEGSKASACLGKEKLPF